MTEAAKPSFMSSATWKEMELSEELYAKLEEGFKKIDDDDSGSVSMEEAEKMFKSFKKLGVGELLEAMDEDKDGYISKDEWMFYFKKVRRTELYTDEEIMEEVDMFLEGYGFMKFETEKEGEENNANGEADEKARASAAKEEMKEHHGRIN